MAHEPALSGEVLDDGILDVLREVEKRRITGRLRFTTRSETGQMETGEVELIGGQIALDQEAMPDGSDPVERLLALRHGHYAVHQRLPNLPVSKGNERRRTGSLGVHVAADLMNYCEQAGLTGTLTLSHEGERVEAVYEFGELLAIRAQGEPDADLSHVFGWTEGNFVIEVSGGVRDRIPGMSEEQPISAETPLAEPTAQFVRTRRDPSSEHFLEVFEVALTDILEKREKARPSSRPRANHSLGQSVRPRMPAMQTPPPRRREPTVRVVYLKPDDPTTASVASDQSARPERARSGAEGSQAEAKPPRVRSAHPGSRDRTELEASLTIAPLEGSAAVGWILLVTMLGGAALGLLHRLAAS